MSDFEFVPPEDLSALMPEELVRLCFERWTEFNFVCREYVTNKFLVEAWARDASGKPYEMSVRCETDNLVRAQRALLMEFLGPGMAS